MRFTFRARAGEAQAGDEDRKIRSGSGFTFSQRIGKPGERRLVRRRPLYQVTVTTEAARAR